MTNIYFCEPEHHYQSYDDWYALAFLSGFQIIPVKAVDVHSDNVYIVNHFGAISLPGNEHEAKARIILWQLEWGKLEQKTEYPQNVREIWASDAWYADYYSQQGLSVKYVPMGSHYKLPERPPVPNSDKAHDVAVMMYRGPWRRQRAIAAIEERGLTVAPDSWGVERDLTLRSSRCMVHIHQHDDVATIAPLRFAIAAAYRLPLFTERCANLGGFSGRVFEADNAELAVTIQDKLRPHNSHVLFDYGTRLYQYLCHDMTFRRSVEGSL